MKKIKLVLIISLLFSISSCIAETKKMIIEKAPTTYFKAENGAKLGQYPEQQQAMQEALETYWNGKFTVIRKKLFLSNSFGIGVKRQLDDFIIDNQHGKKIDEHIVEGLSSVTVWKVGDEYFSLVVSEMVPSGNAIYGYYEIKKFRTKGSGSFSP
jgi:hypothetical protein